MLYFLKKNILRLMLFYYKQMIPSKVKSLRDKKKVKVLFVLSEISKWKTEQLYLTMRGNKRFEPIIGITLKMDDKPLESATKLLELVDYLKLKNYSYHELIRAGYIQREINPDIIIYQEPYLSVIPREFNFLNNFHSLFISITYSFHTVLLPFDHYADLKQFAWFDCYENSSTALSAQKYTHGKRKNIIVTGLPMMDDLQIIQGKDPWKLQKNNKKRIIWAPHHSIGYEYETITYSCFLEFFEFMLDLASKYNEYVQWAFKPHPLLRYKLDLLWGRKKTDEYYAEWNLKDYTQYEDGRYVELFNYSDALIHDCASFTIEYLYTKKPVMYLVNELDHGRDLNDFAKEAFNLHYHGNTKKQIEEFVRNLIENVDPLLEQRTDFYNTSLIAPHGKTASQNIINAILGELEYNNFS